MVVVAVVHRRGVAEIKIEILGRRREESPFSSASL